ncbi:MAG: hypothetical protein Q8S84_09160 [bacterium]|nr:hypothetical protein [bacterium]MDP3381588.1 hypothetical protein [bacterium]
MFKKLIKFLKFDKKSEVQTKPLSCILSPYQEKEATKVDKKEIIFDENALKVLDKNQLNFKELLADLSTTHFLA